MAITDRFRSMPPVTKNLLIINTIIWAATAFIPSVRNVLERYGALYYFTSDDFLPFQLVTYMFIHANFWHLFFNMFALWMFGEMMERTLGSPKFLLYYVSCGIGAGLVQEGVFAIMIFHFSDMFPDPAAARSLLAHTQVTYQSLYEIGIMPDEPVITKLYTLFHTPTVGASGAIFGILLAFGYLFPNIRLYMIFPPVPIRARVFVLIYAFVELAMGIYNSEADTVAHFAHLGGMIVGLLILLYWRKKGVIHGPFT